MTKLRSYVNIFFFILKSLKIIPSDSILSWFQGVEAHPGLADQDLEEAKRAASAWEEVVASVVLELAENPVLITPSNVTMDLDLGLNCAIAMATCRN